MVALAAPLASAGPFDLLPVEEKQFVVGFHAMPRDLEAGDEWNDARILRIDPVLHFAVVATKDPIFEVRARFAEGVRYVEPDPELQFVQFAPNDPSFGSQYGPQQIRGPEAWDTTLGSTTAKVCIVDTGVRYTHQDIAGSRWLGGHDFANGDSDPNDDNGHGTHVAGTAAAGLNNGLNIAGMGNVGIYGVKVLNAAGSGTFSAIASGIRWCSDNGGSNLVISMSLGGSSGTTALQDAVAYAYGRGNLIVAAAGNSGPCSNCVSYPAKYTEAIAVTCTTSSESQCSFSSDGPESELAAPGNGILSLWHTSNTATNTISGTSMSTPHVSGAAALVWSHAPGLTNTELRQILRDTAQDLGAAGWDELYGYGEVDAKSAIDAAGGSPPPPPPPPPGEDPVYSENFDDGAAQGWSLTGLWHVDSACSTPPSTPNYVGYHRAGACDYNTGAANSGTATFGVDLTDATVGTLNFQHRWETESYAGGAYDVMRVQVSTNGGASWTTLQQWDSRNANQPSWGPASFDLDAYAGASVQVRFEFNTVDGVSNGFPGWYVDDVEVTADGGGGTPPPNEPPVANAGADQTVADDDGSGNEAVTLNGAGSSDPDGTITSYAWSEGGSTIATGATPTVTFGVGSHTVTLTVTDDDGATDTDTVAITVSANQAPTASFTHSTSGLGLSVDGSGSSDPDGTLSSWSWSWGDGTPTGSGATASHTYAAAGTYTVTLTVTDNGGASDGESRSITVTSGPTTVYFEDFDDGAAQGWTKSSGTTDLWRLSADCVTPNSGSWQLAFSRASPNCDYDAGRATGWASSGNIDLSGLASATLTFSHFWQTESYAGGAYDIQRVEVSSNGGSTWTTLQQWDSRNANPSGWQGQSYDVSAYLTSSFRVRFWFDSVDSSFNDFPGWYVDDVGITAS